jgi:hypothetical protein
MDTENVTIEEYDNEGNLVRSETIVRSPAVSTTLIKRANQEIDAISNLADAKAFLRKLIIYLAKALD